MGTTANERDAVTNGEPLAALLAAGVGAFALGLVVILHEIGLFSPPTLYEPSGGVSGRTTLAVILWLAAWAVLHRRWKGRRIEPGRVVMATITLVVLALVLTFPPLWALL